MDDFFRVLSKYNDPVVDTDGDGFTDCTSFAVGPNRGTTDYLENMSMKSNHSKGWMHAILCGMGLVAAVTSTGCQVSTGGQTLPSPYYLHDDVQYYPPGPEFKLAREAAVMKAYQADQQLKP